MDFKEDACIDVVVLALDRDGWLGVVKKVMKLGPQNAGNVWAR